MTDLGEYTLSKRESVMFYAGLTVSGLIISYLLYRNILFAVVIIPFTRRIKGFAK